MSKRVPSGTRRPERGHGRLLARKGFRGPTRILEATDGGFCRATSDRFDLTLATADLGTRFLSSQTNIKPYACCASSHSAVDAVLEIRGEASLRSIRTWRRSW